MEHKHIPNRWGDRVWQYFPINYLPEKYYELSSWWLDKIPNLGDSIMDVGCYTALALIWLKKHYPDKKIMGVDINQSVVLMAKARVLYNDVDVPITCIDGFNLYDYEYQSVDLIFHGGLLEHYCESDRIKMLKEHLRVAKKVLITVPVKESLEEGTGYGDEYGLTFLQWSDFFKKYFNVVEEFTNDDKINYACIINGIKE